MCLRIESFHINTLLFRTVHRPFKLVQVTLLHIVADNVQEIIKKQCEFAQCFADFEYAIMSKDIVSEFKGRKL